jgi:hypothetical protein
MITVLIDGRVHRRVAATLHSRAYWCQYAQSDPRNVQVWETTRKASHRLV